MAWVSQHISTDAEKYLSMVGGVATGSNPATSVNVPRATTDTIPIKGSSTYDFISVANLATWVGEQTHGNVDIDGGAVDGTVIGANAAAAATFTDLTATGTVTLNNTLDAIAALAVTDGNIIVGNGTTWVAESGATARTSLGLGTGDIPTFAGLTVGSVSVASRTITDTAAGTSEKYLRFASNGGNAYFGIDDSAGSFFVGAAYETVIYSPTNNLRVTSPLSRFTGTVTIASDLTLSSGSITSASGAISFGNENLSTTGTGTFAGLTTTGSVSVGTSLILGTASAPASGHIYKGPTTGTVIYAAAGSTYDFILANSAGSNVITVATGTINTVFAGTLASGTITVSSDLTLASGSITSASGAISFGNENLSTTGEIRIGGAAGGYPIDLSTAGYSGGIIRATRGTSIFAAFQSTDGPGFVGMESADDLTFRTSAANRYTIDSSGNHNFQSGSITTTGTLTVTSNIIAGSDSTPPIATNANEFVAHNNTRQIGMGVSGSAAYMGTRSAHDLIIYAHNATQASVSASAWDFQDNNITTTGTLASGAATFTGTTNDGSSLLRSIQSGTGRALEVNRSAATATRPVATFANTNAAGGTQSVVLIQQADVGEYALGINSDGSLTAFNFSVKSDGTLASGNATVTDINVSVAGLAAPRVTSSDGLGDAVLRFYSGATYKGGIGWDQGLDVIGIYNSADSASPKIRVSSTVDIVANATVTGTLGVTGNVTGSSGVVISTAADTSTNDATFGAGFQAINTSATDNNHSTYGFYNSNGLVDAQIIGKHISHASRHGELIFMVHDGAALNEVFRLDRSKVGYLAGSLRIGTTSAGSQASKLYVSHTGAAPAEFNSTDASGGYIAISASGTAKSYFGSAGQLISGGSVNDTAVRGQGALAFATGGNTERFRVASDAYALGIGTTDVEAWSSSYGAVQFGGSAIMGGTLSTDGDLFFLSNAYFDGAWKYRSADFAARSYISNSGYFGFDTASSGAADAAITWSEKMRLTNGGNLLLGGTSEAASAAGALHIFNGTAPTGSVTNGIVLYAEDVTVSSELKVRDEAGNVTTLSPHNFSLFGSDYQRHPAAWSYYSETWLEDRYFAVNADMFRTVQLVETLAKQAGLLQDGESLMKLKEYIF